MKFGWVGALAASLCLVACGNGNAPTATNSSADRPQHAAANADDDLAPVFAAELTRPHCPARVDASRYPTPEVVGVRIGMRRDDALAVIYCERRAFNVTTIPDWLGVQHFGQAVGPQGIRFENGARRPCTDQDLMSGGGEYDRVLGQGCAGGASTVVEGTNQLIFIATPGEPGHETVGGIWRHETFATEPTMDSVVSTFIAKFGQPGDRAQNEVGANLIWVFGPTGAPISNSDELFHTCSYNIDVSGLGAVRGALPTCGLTINATIYADTQNPGLAHNYQLGMMNQSVVLQIAQRMQLALQQQAQAAQRSQVEHAASAPAPEL